MQLAWNETIDGVDWDELTALYHAAPLGNKNPDELKTAFGNSMFVCLVRDGGKLVGAGRAVADGVDVSYIADVALLPAYQGCGLGKAIVERLMERSRGHKKIILYAVPGKEPFYKKFGFARMRTAMAVFEDQEGARTRGFVE
jgi:ribosomal protein S18 acetylase RimI-like enzyme